MFPILYAIFATIFVIGVVLYFSWSKELPSPEAALQQELEAARRGEGQPKQG